jgi:phosphatidylglycerophosphatase A
VLAAPEFSLYDVLAVQAPAGAAAGETLETAQKETVDRDEETLVVDELVGLAG